MKIKRITLYNIGPYVDLNTFDFTIDKDKNIVLIGGKNGAGKTTFFKAIKTCLYGCKVWGYDAPGKEYYNIISGLVNFKTMYENSANAYIEIELVFNDGKQINSYVLHREWKKIKMSLSEFFHIKKNDRIILGSEEDDFINYLLSIIPPDMFNFYFFDGEAIAEFFLGADGNKNFRNAFLKLYGLDTLSIMIDNFNRNIKKNDSKKSNYELYRNSRLDLEQQEQKLQEIKNELTQMNEKIDLFEIKLRSLQDTYSKEGGIGLAEWKELNNKIIKEENDRDSLNRWLKEIANHYLPFIILEKRLQALLSDLYEMQEKQKRNIFIDTISNNTFNAALNVFLANNNVANLDSIELIDFLKNTLKNDSIQSLEFDFSEKQISHIISQIYEKLNFDKSKIKLALSQLNSSLRNSKRLREQLTSSSIDNYEMFVEEKEKIEKLLNDLYIEVERKKQEYNLQEEKVQIATKEYLKRKNEYSNSLKSKSIIDISERAAATYSLLEEKLVKRQAQILQNEFLECFSSIINKDNFIDGIVIDKNINIVPYKFIKITRNQLDNYKTANKDFLNLFENVKFTIDINRLEFDEVDFIKLPSPIKAPFSQGERQVYIMSIYLALLKTSHKDIPFFIDTPFARIDSNHRINIVNEFFNKIKNQLFILSTDEEIVGEYKNAMGSKISDLYTLQINKYGTTRINAGKYFGE